ncbi:MAG: non-canonical purine NTP pyrophosphatase [Cetobacterium sp.]
MSNKNRNRKIYFLSSNEYKFKEVKGIIEEQVDDIEILQASIKIDEIQNEDMEIIVKDKIIKAFNSIRQPVIVEQTGLELKDLNGFPGGLTQIFWDKLKADKFSQYFSSKTGSGKATAKTIVAYCDGRKIRIFKGKIKGKIVDTPRGDRKFQWDCVFEPKGEGQTFSEMGNRKNEISMRKKALKRLCRHLMGGDDE